MTSVHEITLDELNETLQICKGAGSDVTKQIVAYF